MGLPELREEVIEKCNQLQLLYALNFQLDAKSKKKLDEVREAVPYAVARDLRKLRDILKIDLNDFRRRVGSKLKPSLLKHVIDYQNDSAGTSFFVPKYILEDLFSNYRSIIPDWDHYPIHYMIEIDPQALTSKRGRFHYAAAEMLLYQDMTVAYNEAQASKWARDPKTFEKAACQRHAFFTRSAVLFAFNFVEAYLNGAAFDFFHRTCDRELSTSESDLLLEWDSKKGREKWVKFRDKMVHYPKVILGAEEPPLTESNCPEIQTLAVEGRYFRDALTHNSPKVELEIVDGRRSAIGRKVRSIVYLNPDHATLFVDAAVGYVSRINTLLGKYGHMLEWMQPRDPATGLFPPAA